MLACACAGPDSPAASAQSASGAVTAYEGARLIVGDGRTVIDDGVMVVEGGKLTAVGPRSKVSVPAAAARVSLTGKTVMPVLVDLHSHVGFSKEGIFEPEHYTRENIVDQLRRLEYYGVGAILSLGTDVGPDTFVLREEQRAGKLDTVRMFLAGRGFVAPGGGPPVSPLEHVPFEVDRPGLARLLVRELAAQKVDMVKLWVDDRQGTKPKLAPDVYRAVIDEAHKQKLRVMAHVWYLDDAKDLLKAGIDGFAHTIRDRVVDSEFIQMAKSRNVWVCSASSVQTVPTPEWIDHAALAETVAPATISALKARLKTPPNAARSSQVVQTLLTNIKTLYDAGVPICFGTDTVTPNHFYGFNEHIELASYVRAGLTPAQAIGIATETSARLLGVTDLGSLQQGKSADFIVLDANPIDDIGNTLKISAVYRRGAAVNRAALKKAWSAPTS